MGPFFISPPSQHLWGCKNTRCGAGPGEKTGFCSNAFLRLFCSYGKTDVGETCCSICLGNFTSEMPGPARC